jgi:outer membrane murein-binding lipoprotein Lpp
MRYIIAATLILSTLLLSGCHFSAWDWGWLTENEKQKLGFIDTDIHYLNAERDAEDKQTVEEFNKKEGFVFGFLIERKF